MTGRTALDAAREDHMERRIIHVETLPDQAGIAAALRRAFAAGPQKCEEEDPFIELLKQIH